MTNEPNYNWTRFWITPDVEFHKYDYLPDPELPYGNKQFVTYEKISHIPCLILLGNPGIGKTRTIEQIANNLKQQDELCILENFWEYSDFGSFITEIEANSDFQKWKHSEASILYLFLDSLDEGRLEMHRLEYDLERYLKRLPIKNLRLRITCRPAELPTDFVPRIKNLWGDKEDSQNQFVQVYQLAQLREKDVYQASEQRKIPNVEEFMRAIDKVGIRPFAAHPITLDMLFRIYESQQEQLPSERSKIYEFGCRELANVESGK